MIRKINPACLILRPVDHAIDRPRERGWCGGPIPVPTRLTLHRFRNPLNNCFPVVRAPWWQDGPRTEFRRRER